MAFSLGFHIIFAAIGMTMPFFMSAAHWLYLKKGDEVYLELTKMWVKGVAILFAVGAVSGTVLSFELGLLWPGFMQHAGPIIGMPFSWEGTAFFIEAVAIGLFLYGRKRMNRWVHWWTGMAVGISGFASGIFVVAANSWMNTPAGFDWVDGKAVNPVDEKRVKAMMKAAGYPLVFVERMGIDTNSHQCGTVRFGDDPATSVLDPYCRAHEVENLYVMDSSFFPLSAAMNGAR